MLVVSREGRVEDMIPDLPAVQEKLVVAQAGHVNAGFRDLAADLEVLPQVGCGIGLLGLTDSLILPAGTPVCDEASPIVYPWRADPVCRPIGFVQQSHLPPGDRALQGFVLLVGPYPDLPEILPSALQLLPGIGNMDRLIGGDLSGVPGKFFHLEAVPTPCDKDLISQLLEIVLGTG